MARTIGTAVLKGGKVTYRVRAEGPGGRLGDLVATVTLEEFEAAGWKTDGELGREPVRILASD